MRSWSGELLDLAGGGYSLVWVQDLAGGLAELDVGADCVLVDLGLPDAEGLEAVRAVVDHPTGAAVIVLTGLSDRSLGGDAMLLGAQDYLIKGMIDHETLARSVRYAITRRHNQEASRQLGEAHLLRAENARMERGLVARPIVHHPRLSWAVRYEAGGRRALLGGDFFDAIELDDGAVRVVVGDICGHGADEAALGVALRVSWRALVLSGSRSRYDARIGSAGTVVRTELGRDIRHTLRSRVRCPGGQGVDAHRRTPQPARRRARRRPGYPGRATRTSPRRLRRRRWPPIEVNLGATWTLVVFTDGIIEGHTADGSERFDSTMLARVAAEAGPSQSPRELADTLVEAAEKANGEPLKDDVALVILAASPPDGR